MDEILLMQNFCLISGLSADEAEQWEPLVLACWEELKGKLRAGVDVKNTNSVWLLHVQHLQTIDSRVFRERCVPV